MKDQNENKIQKTTEKQNKTKQKNKNALQNYCFQKPLFLYLSGYSFFLLNSEDIINIINIKIHSYFHNEFVL